MVKFTYNLKILNMGWWSKDIMGGDSPLDAKDEIYGICGVDEFGDGDDDNPGREIKREDIEAHLPEILEAFRKVKNNDYYDEAAIYFQVLGVLMMKTGTPISPELKQEILDKSQTDSWAKEDLERGEIVENFHVAIEKYDGTPIVIRSRGLFEAISDHIENGGTGLVNVGKNIE
jgi:hypothetical protein